MLSLTRLLLLSPVLLLFVPFASAADEAAAADEQLLRTLNLPSDGPGLVEFFKKRTLRDGDRPKIQDLIRNLGNDEFEVREKSMHDLVAIGAVAEPLLKEALKEKDIEILRRVESCLELAKKTSTSEAMAAAVRHLGRHATAAGAAEALLDFLPFLDDESVIDEFGTALARTGVKDSTPEPALAAALTDKNPLRRAVAAEALGRAAGDNDALRRAARAFLKDADVQVRRRAAFGLLTSKDREAVPVLIALLAEVPAKQTWRIEENLYNLAGDKPPTYTGTRTDDEGRKKYRDVWASWWKDNETKIDLTKLGAPKPYLGYTILSHSDLTKGNRSGKVYELDGAGKVRWEIETLANPLDAQMLPNGNVLLIEQVGQLITERSTTKGEIVWQRNIPQQAVAVRRLANGNTFIASRSQLLEMDGDKKDVWTVNRPNADIISAARLPGGGAVILTNTGNIITLDAAGKEGKSFNIGQVYYYTQIDVLPSGRILVPLYTQNKVIEYDAEGRNVWEVAATRPTNVQRLPNGNTLISSRLTPTVTEVNRSGESVWTHQVAQGRMVKASRR
jgi:outer membrane protein assembly factor BamB